MEDECFFHQNYFLIQAHWIKNNNNKDNICKKNIMIWYLQKKKNDLNYKSKNTFKQIS
jgi:hypothetical protein